MSENTTDQEIAGPETEDDWLDVALVLGDVACEVTSGRVESYDDREVTIRLTEDGLEEFVRELRLQDYSDDAEAWLDGETVGDKLVEDDDDLVADGGTEEESAATTQIELHPDEPRPSSVFFGVAVGLCAAAISTLYSTYVVGEPLKWWILAGSSVVALIISYVRYRREVMV